MNCVQLVGRLTRDPEVRYIPSSGTAVASFTLAIDRGKTMDGQPKADFIKCKAFGKQAETIEQYVKKGNRFGVTGRIESGNFDRANGEKGYYTEVIVNTFDFLEGRREDGSIQD